jgi:hypothetical protein
VLREREASLREAENQKQIVEKAKEKGRREGEERPRRFEHQERDSERRRIQPPRNKTPFEKLGLI